MIHNNIETFSYASDTRYQGTKMTTLENATIDIDIRPLLFDANAMRGIGHYIVNHVGTIIKLLPSAKIRLLSVQGVTSELVNKLASASNVTIENIYSARSKADIHFVTDPMSINFCYDDPFSLIPAATSVSVLFFDLTPLVLREMHFEQFTSVQKGLYLQRLESTGRRAQTILAISDSTKSDLLKAINYPDRNIHTIMGGLNYTPSDTQLTLDAVKKKFNISKPFFLAVGGQDPHKSFETSLSAYLQIRQKHDVAFIVAGSLSDPYKCHYKKKLEAVGMRDVIFTDFIKQEELDLLYKDALCLAFPSRYEGFGLPVLEALARGCPVITTRASSLPEVGGDAALYITPGDIKEMAHHMSQLITDGSLRETLSVKGIAQVRKFTWEESARRTVQAWNVQLGNTESTSHPQPVSNTTKVSNAEQLLF